MNTPPEPWQPPPRSPGPSPWRWWLGLMLALGALIGYLAWRFPDAVSSERDWMRVTYLVALAALVSTGLVARRRPRLKRAARQAAIWLGVGLTLVIGYSFRNELGAIGERVLGELVPHRGVATGGGAITFQPREDGHFVVEAVVDGVPVRFLVDTGASDVVLTLFDARRLGFDPDGLAYTRLYATANGMVRGAPVRLGEVVVGPIRLTGVAASVNESPMNGSLLGLSFLGRLSGYEVRGGALTLRQ